MTRDGARQYFVRGGVYRRCLGRETRNARAMCTRLATVYTAPVRELPRSLVRSLEQQGEGLGVLVLRLGAMGDILRTLPPV